MDGWVKLHRKMIEWEWYQNENTKSVFIHLLLMANHKPGKWKGIDVQRGQLITGRQKLAHQLGTTEQRIRTAFSNLQNTNEITIKPTNRFSLITICNYEEYQVCISESNQPSNQQTTSHPTNKQPTDNHKQEEKKEKKVRIKKEVNSDALRLAGNLLANIQKADPGHKGAKVDKWALDIEKLMRIDGRPVSEISAAIDWLPGNFWGTVILSGKKLRDKFPEVVAAMKKPTGRTVSMYDKNLKVLDEFDRSITVLERSDK